MTQKIAKPVPSKRYFHEVIEEEQKIINMNLSSKEDKIKPVVTTKQILTAQNLVNEVYMDEKIEKYILLNVMHL